MNFATLKKIITSRVAQLLNPLLMSLFAAVSYHGVSAGDAATAVGGFVATLALFGVEALIHWMLPRLPSSLASDARARARTHAGRS